MGEGEADYFGVWAGVASEALLPVGDETGNGADEAVGDGDKADMDAGEGG